MFLYKKAIPRDIEKIKQQALKGYGIDPNSNRRPHGFGAVVGFDFGDIYIDDTIAEKLSAELKEEIEEILLRFLKNDYGDLNADERDYNIENRYFGGGLIIGRYELSCGKVEMKLEDGKTEIKII